MWQSMDVKYDIEAMIKRLEENVKNGNPTLENIRCVFTTDEDGIIHLLTPFDFIDLNPRPNIKSFSLYQAFKN